MSVTHTVPPVEAGRTWFQKLVRAREFGLAVLIIALIAVTVSVQPTFVFSDGGWRELLRQPTILILIALGEAIVIITRNIDLSIGSILCLSTYTAGWLFANVEGIPIVLVVVIGVALGAFLGLINGLLVAFLKVPSLVITLGTLYAYRGIAILWIGPHFIRSSWLPPEFRALRSLLPHYAVEGITCLRMRWRPSTSGRCCTIRISRQIICPFTAPEMETISVSASRAAPALRFSTWRMMIRKWMPWHLRLKPSSSIRIGSLPYVPDDHP